MLQHVRPAREQCMSRLMTPQSCMSLAAAVICSDCAALQHDKHRDPTLSCLQAYLSLAGVKSADTESSHCRQARCPEQGGGQPHQGAASRRWLHHTCWHGRIPVGLRASPHLEARPGFLRDPHAGGLHTHLTTDVATNAASCPGLYMKHDTLLEETGVHKA